MTRPRFFSKGARGFADLLKMFSTCRFDFEYANEDDESTERKRTGD